MIITNNARLDITSLFMMTINFLKCFTTFLEKVECKSDLNLQNMTQNIHHQAVKMKHCIVHDKFDVNN